MSCHCGNPEPFETCCQPLLKGERLPKTAAELMRLCYSAFTVNNIDYIMNSHDPDTVHQVDRDSTESWSKEAKWTGLEITDTEAGGEDDNFGRVDFVANYELRGVKIAHRESATFRKHGKRWLFVDGEQINGPPVRREGPKIGRNDPCHCGSGKKYKKCHGAEA